MTQIYEHYHIEIVSGGISAEMGTPFIGSG